MDLRKIKKLIELLDESGIAEIEVTEGEESVRISRYGASPAFIQTAAPVAHPAGAAAVVDGSPAAPAAAAAPAAEERSPRAVSRSMLPWSARCTGRLHRAPLRSSRWGPGYRRATWSASSRR